MNLNILKKKNADKPVKLSLREKKHQANLRKNSGLYFQIGLIATLFIVFGLFQLKFEKKSYVAEIVKLSDTDDENTNVSDFIVEKDIPKEIVEPIKAKQPTSLENPKIIDDTDTDLSTLLNVDPVIVDKAPKIIEIDVVDEEPKIDTIPVSLVSEYPVFPGCDKIDDKQKMFECFQQKISKHIINKFDAGIASDNGLSGKQKIMVTFLINVNGEIVDVKARAPHPELQKEAIKAVESLPVMKPAKQGFKKVNVTYSLPIIFNAQ